MALNGNTQLENFIQYYIGCPCLNTWFQANHSSYNAGWKLTGFLATSPKPFHLETDTEYNWTDSIKLILRRLSDITKDEEAEYEKLLYRRTDGVHSVIIRTETPESYHYLLKKHFDIFELIDAGLALDSKTLPK